MNILGNQKVFHIDRFLEIFREEFKLELQSAIGWGNNDKIGILFDKAAILALHKYAKEIGVDITM